MIARNEEKFPVELLDGLVTEYDACGRLIFVPAGFVADDDAADDDTDAAPRRAMPLHTPASLGFRMLLSSLPRQ